MIGLAATILRMENVLPASGEQVLAAAGSQIGAGQTSDEHVAEFGSHLLIGDRDRAGEANPAGDAAQVAGLPPLLPMPIPLSADLKPGEQGLEQPPAAGKGASPVTVPHEYVQALLHGAGPKADFMPQKPALSPVEQAPVASMLAAAASRPVSNAVVESPDPIDSPVEVVGGPAAMPLILDKIDVTSLRISAHHRPVVRSASEVSAQFSNLSRPRDPAPDSRQISETALKPATTAPTGQPGVQTAVDVSAPDLVQSSDVVQQIASVFSKLVDDPASVTEAQSLRSQYPAGQAPVLRVLNLVLKPEELGQVAIKMKLSGQSLSVEVIAEKSSTHRLLEAEARKLAEHIVSGGYELEQLSIQQQLVPSATAPKDGSPAGRPGEPANYPQGGPQAGQGQQDAQGRRNEHGRPSDANAPRSREAVSDPGSLPRSGIYL